MVDIISSFAPIWRDFDCESHLAKEVTLPVPGQDRESVPEPAEVMNEGNIGAKADSGDSSPEILFSQPEAAQDRGTRCFLFHHLTILSFCILSNTILSKARILGISKRLQDESNGKTEPMSPV